MTSTGDSSVHHFESEALRNFHEQVLQLSIRFNAKEVARAMGVSTRHMRSYGEKHNVTFASPEGRTPNQLRRLRRELSALKEETRVKHLQPIRPSPGPNGLVLSPELQRISREAFVQSENKFLEQLAVLAKTHTVYQAHRKTKVNLRALRKLAHAHGILFVDQVVPFDEEAANTALVSSGLMGFNYPGLPIEARTCLAGFLMPMSQAN